MILSLSGMIGWFLIASATKADRSTPEVKTRLVDTYTVKQENVNITISGLGAIIPSRQVILYPEVSGRVDKVMTGLMPGLSFEKNELLLSISPEEFQNLVNEQKALVSQAESNLQLETGQQNIARLEYEMTGNTLSPEEEALVLRQPQLESAKAALQQAEANLAQAELNLARTLIKAPFSGQIINSSVEEGSRITNSSELIRLVSTESFRMELEVSAAQVKWLSFSNEPASNKGSTVEITSPTWKGQSRKGQVMSLSPELNAGSRMAKVIISIDDPLSQKPENQEKPKVLLNDLLRAKIIGKTVDNVAVVPDELIRNTNQIWVLSDENTLEIRTIMPIYRDSEKTIMSFGVESGEQIIRSSLATPVNGLPLRTADTPLNSPLNSPLNAPKGTMKTAGQSHE